MTSAATEKTTTKSSSKGQQNGQTLTQMEEAQRELADRIAAQKQKEQERAWATLSHALPLAARGEAFGGQAVRDALELVGLLLDDFKSDARNYAAATKDDDDELSQFGDDHALSAKIKAMKQEARENVVRVDREVARLRGLVGRRSSHRETLRKLRRKGYCLDVR